MSSLVPGFEYDVFISYRHRDNKYDGWVTEFVSNLRKELEATFKEAVTVYFDENPRDGILENHDVDDTIRNRIRSVVFIPVVSQTYCDTKSFAWNHELLAFRELSERESGVLKVTLNDGNVASRILPVMIHELSENDHATLECVIGRVRSIDFIFRSPGVNRPLRAKDDEIREITHHVLYRDQINKVANAVKSIVLAVKGNDAPRPHVTLVSTAPQRRRRVYVALGVVGIVLALALAGYYFPSWNGFSGSRAELYPREKSIAVLPFKNLTDEKNTEYFADGVMTAVLNHMSRVHDLRVISITTVEQYRGRAVSSREIADELGVSYILNGAVQRENDKVRVSVSLIDAVNDRTIWSKDYDRQLQGIFSVQSEVAQEVARLLEAGLSKEVRENIINIPTTSLDAYDLFLRGQAEMSGYWDRFSIERIEKAMPMFLQAIEIDPYFSLAHTGLGHCYWMLAHFDDDPSTAYWMESRRALKRAIELDPSNGWAYAEYGVVQHNWEWDIEGARDSFKKAVALMPNDPLIQTHVLFFNVKTNNCDDLQVASETRARLFGKMPGVSDRVFLLLCRRDLSALKQVLDSAKPADGWSVANGFLAIKRFEAAIEVSDYWIDHSDDTVLFLPLKATAMALKGDRQGALSILDEIHRVESGKHISATYFAQVYMALGDRAKAFQYLEKALNERDWLLHTIQYNSPFYEMYDDPQLQDIIRRSWIPMGRELVKKQ